MRIDFSPPDITEDDIAAVAETLRSGWITSGVRVLEFEGELAKWCNTTKVAALNSATAALTCVLELLDIGPGDEVITSAYTFSASASVVLHVGATPVLVDCLPGSYSIDPAAVAEAVTSRTKAVIPVDIGGVMVDYDALREALEKPAVRRYFDPRAGTLQELFTRVPIIADAAHSFGARYRGRPSGSVADFTAFSFHAVKNLTTAEGGALTWQSGLGDQVTRGNLEAEELDAEIYHMIKLYCLHGQDKDALAKSQGGWEYDIIAPLYKCNLTDIAATLGLSQLRRYGQTLDRRSELVRLYASLLAEGAKHGGYELDILNHHEDGFESNMHLMMVRLVGRDDAFRRRFIMAMQDRGVACNVHFKPLPLLTAYAMLGFDMDDYPNAWARYENEVSLPLHLLLTDEDVRYVCDCFVSAYKECLDG